MTPIQQYEAQQRALETERFNRIAKALEEDAKLADRIRQETHVDRVYAHEQLRPMTKDELFQFNHPSKTQNAYNQAQLEPTNFCATYDEWEPVPAWVAWVLRVVFVLALAAVFLLAGLWVTA